MRHNQRTRAVAGAAIVAALALAGCGSDGSGGSGDSSHGSGSGSGSSKGGAGSTAGGGAAGAMDPATLKTGGTPLGTVLVDGRGRTVYLFTQDRTNSNTMRCDAACLKEWPPVQGKPKAGSGVDDGLIDTTKAGGRTQATYAGHPLYYYAGDRSQGDVKGQGIDKIWYALDAAGHAVKKAPGGSGSGGGRGGGDHGAGATGGYGY